VVDPYCQIIGIPEPPVPGADKFAQSFHRLVMTALHETADPVAAEGVRDVVVLDRVAAGARSACAKGGERAQPHVDACCVMKSMILHLGGGMGRTAQHRATWCRTR
jgi:hypothetical protein